MLHKGFPPRRQMLLMGLDRGATDIGCRLLCKQPNDFSDEEEVVREVLKTRLANLT